MRRTALGAGRARQKKEGRGRFGFLASASQGRPGEAQHKESSASQPPSSSICPLVSAGCGSSRSATGERRTEVRPQQVGVDDGTRRYYLSARDADVDAFDPMLDKIDPAWRDHLTNWRR